MTASPPRVGDVLRSNAQEWVVVEVAKDAQGQMVVTLEPIDGRVTTPPSG